MTPVLFFARVAGEPNHVQLNWNTETDVPDNLIQWEIIRNGSVIPNTDLQGFQRSYIDQNPASGLNQYEVRMIVPSLPNNNQATSNTIKFAPANGQISGKITTSSGITPIAGVLVCARQKTAIPSAGAGTEYCATTLADGFYSIDNIYYGEGVSFEVTPAKANNIFNPTSTERRLSPNGPTFQNVDFFDITSYSVSGRVVQIVEGVACGLPGVSILVGDGNENLDRGIRTNAQGEFTAGVDETGTYVFTPSLGSNAFTPTERELVVDRNLTGVDFSDVTTYTLSGYVRASCEKYIGQATLEITATSGCDQTVKKQVVTEEGTGYYEVILPARDYRLNVQSFTPTPESGLEEGQVLGFFQSEEINLTEGGQEVDFTYRRDPIVQLRGLEDAPCVDLDYTIVEQSRSYPLVIEVWEEVGVCPIDTGTITILDGTGDEEVTVTLPISQGIALYTLRPGTPNIISPHLKKLSITADVGGRIKNIERDMIVTGVRAREQTFATVSPELPLLILRDPPGDASSCYLEKNTTVETAMSFSTLTENTQNPWTNVRVGHTFISGFLYFTEVSIWGDIGSSTEIGAATSENREYIVNHTVGERFSTSDNPEVTGTKGDVFMGAALNLIYALADNVSYDADSCKIDTEVTLIMGNDGFATTYTYTEDHIRQSLLPDLRRLEMLNRTVNPDTAAYFANQISVWEQTLQRNEQLKEEAKFVENRSFSANAPFESTTTSSSTASIAIEFTQTIVEEVALELGLEIAGTGFSGGNRYTFRMETGESRTQTTTEETTAGFILNDDDAGDFYSVDIKTDPVYNTPVFSLVSGRSSCPYEEGTQPRDDLQIRAEEAVKTNLDPSQPAVYKLLLGNISQSDETRTYVLTFNQSSNPDGARIRIGGSEVQAGIPYNIPPGQQQEVTVEVERGPLAYSYDGLEFFLSSSCDGGVQKSTTISAFFQSDCSPIRLQSPERGWIVNGSDDSDLTVQLVDYDKNALQRIELEINRRGTANWETVTTITPDELSDNPAGTSVSIDLSDYDDATYQVRARLLCEQGFIYSSKVEGVLDRSAPLVFGEPEPVDDEYLPGDRIGLTFNESLNCLAVTSENVSVTRLSDGAVIPASVGCSGNGLIILPEEGFAALVGAQYEVSVVNIADLYGNVNTDTISWTFSIAAGAGNPSDDIDGDGILNDQDNCPLSANPLQSDIDGDGTGDNCDADIDGDGIDNQSDNAPYSFNPDQADNNGNGVGDVAEEEGDGDNDGVANAQDNCPNNPNGEQSDVDQDGIGDACDVDIDGDGILNFRDNCPTVSNVDQIDADNDGIGDACKDLTTSTNDPNDIESFTIYPNPGNNLINVEVIAQRSQSVSLSIYDAFGREVSNEMIRVVVPKSTLRIPTSHLASGLYYVVLNDGRSIQSRQLVISH